MNPSMLPQTGLKGAIASTMFGKKKKKKSPSTLPASVAATAPVAPTLPR